MQWSTELPNDIRLDPADTAEDGNGTNITDLIYNKGVQATFGIAYTVIFVLGVLGNALVCHVVIRNRTMQTVTNLFITNLALSDILLCIFAVPFTPIYTFLGTWVFGDLMCHIMPYAQGCSVYISTLTLTSIAIDRYFVIIYPFKPRMKIRTCILLIVFIWVFSLVVTFPYGYCMSLNEIGESLYCEETWSSDVTRKIFGAITTTMQFVLPFIIIAFCYTRVSIRLNNRMKCRLGSKSSRKEDMERERKKRTNRMLIAMVAIFGISWLPLNLVNISSDFYSDVEAWPYQMTLFFLAHFIAMSSTCYNPFLYAWLNENFRKEFKQILPCLAAIVWRKKKSLNHMERTDMFRSEKTCNGNETIQESLMNSTVNRPSLKYKFELNGSDLAISEENLRVNATSEGSPDCKRDDSPSSTEDCIKLYMLVDKSENASDKQPIVSLL